MAINLSQVLSETLSGILSQVFSRHSGKTQRVYDPVQAEKSLDDIRLVGKDKLLGYLPLDTITDLCRADPLQLKKAAEEKGLTALLLKEREARVYSGALYVYDAPNLTKFLQLPQNRSILERNGWPVEADSFVKRSMIETVDDKPLYDLIALSYNDKRYASYKTLSRGPVPFRY